LKGVHAAWLLGKADHLEHTFKTPELWFKLVMASKV
jgi:hypothetical protein